MKKSLLIVTVAASAFVATLFNLPKVIVSDNQKQLATQTSSAAQQASSSHIGPEPEMAGNHTPTLSADQISQINRLRNNYLSDTNTEKKIKFADSLANSFTKVNKFDSAAKYLEAVASLAPSEKSFIRAGDGYYEAFQFAVNSNKGGDLGEKARAFYQKALDNNANLLDVKAKMAMTYVTSSNPMQGITMLREVIAKDPKNELALFNLGILSMQSGQYDRAIERFTQIMKLNPTNAEARLYLAISYVETGRKKEAKELFTSLKSEEKDPAIQATVTEYLQKLN